MLLPKRVTPVLDLHAVTSSTLPEIKFSNRIAAGLGVANAMTSPQNIAAMTHAFRQANHNLVSANASGANCTCKSNRIMGMG